VANAFKYAYPGPPFNWLGTFTLSQKNAFKDWAVDHLDDFPGVELFYRIRAQQFRKTAGLLEKYYSAANPPLAPTFQKAAWQPGPMAHWIPAPRDDHDPMVYVSEIKSYLQPQLEYVDDAVFMMNHMRTLIERIEDEAQYASMAAAQVSADLVAIENLFTQPQYQAVLVDDVNSSNMYKGQPYFRTNALDAPTTWELEQQSKSTDGTIKLKYVDTEAGE
jgi:hypothetical protein